MIYNVINMNTVYKDRKRKKAFIGALIGVAGSVVGGILSGNKAKKQAAAQAAEQERLRKEQELKEKRLAEYNRTVNSTNSLNNNLVNADELENDFTNQYMKLGGKASKYKNRNRKAWGGWGDVAGGLISATGSIVSGATGNPVFATAGNAISGLANTAINNANVNRNTARIQKNLNAPLSIPDKVSNANYRANLPTRLRYGGRHMTLVSGSKGVKVKPRRV